VIKNLINNKFICMILFIGTIIRLYGIQDVGLNHYDSAYYANIAKVPSLTVKWFFNESEGNKDLPSLKRYLKNRGGTAHIVKPGHIILITLSFLIFGIKDHAVLIVSAVCGIGVIIMSYLIGKELFTKPVGFIAAAIIAVSGQQMIFSRTGYPQMNTTFIFCLAFFLFWKSINIQNGNKLFRSSAIITGLTLLFHQSVYIVIFPLFIAMMVNVNKPVNGSLSSKIRKCFHFFVIMLIPLLLSQLFVMAINSIHPSGGEDLLMRNLGRLQSGAFDRWGISNEKLSFYPIIFWMLEGPLITILLPISIIFTLWKAYKIHSINYVLLGLLTSIPLLFWTLNYTTLKAIQVAMPFIAISVGVFIVDVSKQSAMYYNRKKIQTLIPILVVLVILSFGLVRSYPHIKFKSNYKLAVNQLIEYMNIHGGVFNVNQNNLWPISTFYSGNFTDTLPSDFKGEILFDNGNIQSDFKIIDWRQFIPGKTNIVELENIINNYEPIIQLPYGEKAYPIWHYHRYYDTERIPKLFKDVSATNFISVYDLRKN